VDLIAVRIIEILEFLAQAETRLEDLSSRSERIAAIDKEIELSKSKLRKSGNKLSKDRTEAASRLAKAITSELVSKHRNQKKYTGSSLRFAINYRFASQCSDGYGNAASGNGWPSGM